MVLILVIYQLLEDAEEAEDEVHDQFEEFTASEDDIIATTDEIRNIEVDAEIVNVDEFEIIDKTETRVDEPLEDSNQKPKLTFDLFNQKIEFETTKKTNREDNTTEDVVEKKIVYELNEDLSFIEVNEPEYINNTKSDNVVKYQLEEDDNNTIEAEENEEDFLQFKTKTEESTKEIPVEAEPKDVDPLNSSINELKARTAERRAKMKQFNYRFTNQNINDIEKQPAYKRAGVELEDPKTGENKLSRTSLHDDNNELTLRKNNSFLHDNVD